MMQIKKEKNNIMEYEVLLIALCCIIIGLILIINNKFYKSKERDFLWAANSNLFLSSIIMLLLGIFILIYELSKYI